MFSFFTSKITLAFLAIVVTFSGWLAFLFQQGQTWKYKTEVQQVLDKAKADKDKYDSLINTLQSNVRELQELSDKQMREADLKFQSFKNSWEQALSKKNDELAAMKIIISKRQTELDILKLKLSTSTSPEERKLLEEKIKEQERLLKEAELRGKGLECLSVPIPSEYAEKVNTI